MPFPKGQSGNKRGRPPGSPNKVPGELREAILAAAKEVGRKIGEEDPTASRDATVAFLVRYAASPHKEERIAFLGLVGKVLPMQVTGEGDGPIRVIIKTEGGPDVA